MGLFDGKSAVITGAARGVGLGYAKLLASEGASVIVNDLGGEWTGGGHDTRPAQLAVDEINAADGVAIANYDDVADWEGGQRVVDQAIDEFGGLDFLICNAGILRDGIAYRMTEEDWDSVVRVHLKGHFVPVRKAVAYWRDRAKATKGPVGGRVVLTSSESGLYGNACQLNYAAAKMGVASMAIVLARELERYGCTANAICPRARTRLVENSLGSFKIPDEGEFDVWHPDNIAPWVAYLCTESASHISGQCFTAGGGTVELVQMPMVANRISKNGRWSINELKNAAAELFEDRETMVGPYPVSGDVPLLT
jgi:NAD(P)-dependent dehydrogenase (short-subunit alcohol dehydrogenase family)